MERLTVRERQILELAARHLTSKQIGPRLGIRPASVDTFMQTIIRKLGVAGRKEAVIAYLASRAASAQGRDDLDFGSPPVDRDDSVRLAQEVTTTGNPERRFFPDTARNVSEATNDGNDRPRQAKTTRPAYRRALASPAWRLVAIAIAALVLGGVTLAAVALGYGLNRTFDQVLVDHSPQSANSRNSQSTEHE